VPLGSTVTLSATVVDAEDGDLSYRTTWTDNGAVLGVGSVLSVPFNVAGTHTIGAQVNDNAGTVSTALVTITVGSATAPAPPPPPPPTSGNAAPVLTITSPTNGGSVPLGSTVTLSATVVDAEDGDLSYRTTWTDNGASLGLGSVLSVSFNVAGTHTIGAQVNDNAGAVSTASVTVTIGATTAPTVSMTSPANGASFVAPTSITFTATASDSDGTIQRVEFYVGATLVGTDTTSPYSAEWPAVIGAYSVSAVATDNSGSSTVSAWRDFIVTATSLLSTAIFIPASPSDAVDYYRFEIFEAGANPNTAAPIAVQNIGVPPVVSGESSADVRSTIVALAPGSYIATVAAIGSAGTLRSNAFAFAR